MSDTTDPAAEMQRLIDADWLQIDGGRLLHHATITHIEPDYETEWHGVRLDCGQRVEWACIPGILTRIGARRCAACCEINSYPTGKGSPINEHVCRAMIEAYETAIRERDMALEMHKIQFERANRIEAERDALRVELERPLLEGDDE